MVIRHTHAPSARAAFLMVELLVAMTLILVALLPLAYSIGSEKRLALAAYQRAIAMEIVDGEIEVLAAGEWRSFASGTHAYPIHALAATNLPPGKFLLSISDSKLRLEWHPDVKDHGGAVLREVPIQ